MSDKDITIDSTPVIRLSITPKEEIPKDAIEINLPDMPIKELLDLTAEDWHKAGYRHDKTCVMRICEEVLR